MRLRRKPPAPVLVPCPSIGELLHRGYRGGLLVPDPLDFAWRYVHESAAIRERRKQRADGGLMLYLGGVPEPIRPPPEGTLLLEWLAAMRMLVWRFDELRKRGVLRHPRSPPLTAGYHPDDDLITKVPPCPALCLALACPPFNEIHARRFDRWLHVVHEITVCERRVRVPNEMTILPWQVVGPAAPLIDPFLDRPDFRGVDRGVDLVTTSMLRRRSPR